MAPTPKMAEPPRVPPYGDCALGCRLSVQFLLLDGAFAPSVTFFRSPSRLKPLPQCWLVERFPLLTDEELRTMFPVLVPLEQTRAYQDIFAKGKADGLK